VGNRCTGEDQTKIWAVLDCSFRTNDGITIIDWKTGRGTTENVSLQLACYAIYAMEKWGIEPDRVKLIEYNHLADRRVDFSLGADEIKYARTYILGSISDMLSMLLDIENNVPKEERFFQKIEDEKIKENCNFKKVCEKGR
jgi:hypothetical protein